ncbi:extracellular solute-binding protein [Neobacillus vireti]|uniref:ABC transporter substrate-binding protein n=1 Tax=Neobacillus vireti TaxID=220686 RepID=UPI002FFF48CA
MKRRFMKVVSVLVVLALFLSLAACSSKSSSSADGKVTLKVLDWNTTNKKEAQKAIVEAVKKELPNVTLQFENINWDKDFNSVMQTRIAGKQLPDIIMIKGGDHPKYAQFLMDLTNEPFMKQFPDDVRKALKVDGKDYAVPYTANFQGVFYNKQIFEENHIQIPKTWAELMDVAKTLKSKGITPFTSHFKDYQMGNSANQFATLEVFSKYPEWGSDLQKGKVSFGKSPEYKTTFEHFKDLYENTEKDPFGVDFTGAADLFANGKTAMWIIGTWAPAQIFKNNPDFKLGFFPTPAVDAENTKLIMQSDYTWSASKATEHPKEVKKVLEILASDKNLAKEYINQVQTQSLLSDVVPDVQSDYVNDINTAKNAGVIDANIGNVQIPWPYQQQYTTYIAEWLLGKKTLDEALKATDDFKSKVKFQTN